jgi:hypothetical protein
VLAPTLFGIQFGIIALIGMTLPIGVATTTAALLGGARMAPSDARFCAGVLSVGGKYVGRITD